VSLNLHLDTHARWTSGTLKSKITELFRDALNRELKTAGITGLPFMFIFEITSCGRLHLHGALDTHDCDEAQIDVIKLALRTAAGRIEGRAAGWQLCLRLVYDGPGWATYLGKVRKLPLARLDLKALMITSHAMTGLARNYHKNARRKRLAN